MNCDWCIGSGFVLENFSDNFFVPCPKCDGCGKKSKDSRIWPTNE